MNIWQQPYPKNINELIEQSNHFQEMLFEKLNDKSCKTLSELYPKNHKEFNKKDLKIFRN